MTELRQEVTVITVLEIAFRNSCQEGNILRNNDKTKSNFETSSENDMERLQVKEWVKVYHAWTNRKELHMEMEIAN